MAEVPVTVVTPVYNGRAYLGECIESVLAQTHSNWTYVVVNNSSDDDSGAIADAFAAKDPRIRVVHTPGLLPMLENWNLAMRQVTPESRYCKMVHADDWLDPACLARMIEVAERNPTVGLVASRRTRGDRVLPPPEALDFEGEVVPGKEACRKRLGQGLSLFGSPTSVLIRADLVRNDPYFFNEDNLRADAEAWLKVLLDTDLGFVREVLTHTRTHEATATSTYWSLGTNMLGNYHLARRFVPQVFPSGEREKLLTERIDTYYLYLVTSVLFGRWARFKYHREGLERLGYGIEVRYVLRALRLIARHASGAPGILLRGLRKRAPMEFYVSEFQARFGHRKGRDGVGFKP